MCVSLQAIYNCVKLGLAERGAGHNVIVPFLCWTGRVYFVSPLKAENDEDVREVSTPHRINPSGVFQRGSPITTDLLLGRTHCSFCLTGMCEGDCGDGGCFYLKNTIRIMTFSSGRIFAIPLVQRNYRILDAKGLGRAGGGGRHN